MIDYPYTCETKSAVISNVVDQAIEKYAQFLDLDKRQSLVESRKYYGMDDRYYHIKPWCARLFREAMHAHIMKRLSSSSSDGERHISIRLGTDYQPEDDLRAVTDQLGMSVYGVFPSKTHVTICVQPDYVQLLYNLEAPYI